jgi:hypothetical protein
MPINRLIVSASPQVFVANTLPVQLLQQIRANQVHGFGQLAG